MEMFNNIERGIANEFDFESHIVKDQRGGKRTRRRKQTKRKRHLKKGTIKKRKQLKKKITVEISILLTPVVKQIILFKYYIAIMRPFNEKYT